MIGHAAARRFGLILCEPGDPVAGWVDQQLRRRGAATQVVTTEALCSGSRWRHTVGPAGARFDVVLADGRRIYQEDVGWVLNRLVQIPSSYLARIEQEDVEYTEQEFRALLCSALHSMCRTGAHVVELPHPYVLAGRWRSPAEWYLLATRAGLPHRPWRWHDTMPKSCPADNEWTSWALVIGDIVLSDPPLSEDVRSACRRLADLAEVSLLHIGLDRSPDTSPVFTGIMPMADLRVAGDRAIDALSKVLSR